MKSFALLATPLFALSAPASATIVIADTDFSGPAYFNGASFNDSGIYRLKADVGVPVTGYLSFFVGKTYNVYFVPGGGYAYGNDAFLGHSLNFGGKLVASTRVRINRPKDYVFFDPGFGSLLNYVEYSAVRDFSLSLDVPDMQPMHITLTLDRLSDVPEPATWLLMFAGFGLIGAATRRQQPVRVSYA